MKTQHNKPLLAVAALLGFGLSSATAQILTNGSFETQTISSGTYLELEDGSTFLTDWTVSGDSIALYSVPNIQLPGPAPEGNQYISFNFAQKTPEDSIFQIFDTTIGQTYEIAFNVGRNGPGSGSLSLLAEVRTSDNDFLASLTASAPGSVGWASDSTFTFTATTTSTRVTFLDTSLVTTDVDVALDNVRVSAVPEPSVITLLIGGGTFAFALARRRFPKE